ncbi:hypothetical protein MTO96_018057 [Rhipicephalus appendiculatus]
MLARQLRNEAQKLDELLTACENEMDTANISEFRNLTYIEHDVKLLMRLISWLVHGLQEERLGAKNPCEPLSYATYRHVDILRCECKELMRRGFPNTSGFRQGMEISPCTTSS